MISTIFSRISSFKTLSSFRVPAYRTYFLGLTGIWGSFGMDMVARTYLVYEITGSAAMLGVIMLAGTAPIVILSLFGGAIADRIPKKLLIQVSHAGFTLIFTGYTIAYLIGYLSPDHPESWWVLFAGGLLMGIFVALSMPARGALIPEIVDRDTLMNAISLNKLGMSFFQMITPVIAGFLIGAFGYTIVFIIMVAMNIMAFIVNGFLPRIAPRPVEHRNVLRDISEGFKYVSGNRTVMLVMIFFISSILLVNPLQTLMPVFAKDILGTGVEGQGTLMSIMGFGSILVTVVLATIPSRSRGRILLFSNLFMGIGMIVFTFSVSWPLSIVMMALIGLGRMGADTCGNTLIQAYTDPSVLGRVNSMLMFSVGLGGTGSFFIGVLAEMIGAPWALGIFSIILVCISVFAITRVSSVRNLD